MSRKPQSAILQVIRQEQYDRDQRQKAWARPTCDYCGQPINPQRNSCLLRYRGDYYHLCNDHCRTRLGDYLEYGAGPVPRVVGLRTVACAFDKHTWEDVSIATPDHGNMDLQCKHCGHYHPIPLY